MCHRLDARFFQELAALPADEVCRRAVCRFDPARGCYLLEAWGDPYEVYPREAEIRPGRPEVLPPSMEMGLAIVFYLMQSQDLPLANEWVSEKDIPGGVNFFQGPHAIPGPLVAQRFGDDLAAFRRVCRSLGGEEAELGDAGFIFRIHPRIPVAVLLWAADDEFPAAVKLLFDRTIGRHLPLDVIFGLCEEVCARLAAAPDPVAPGRDRPHNP